jgi:hypothetical protein
MAKSRAEIEHAQAGGEAGCHEKHPCRRFEPGRLAIEPGQFLKIAAEHVGVFGFLWLRVHCFLPPNELRALARCRPMTDGLEAHPAGHAGPVDATDTRVPARINQSVKCSLFGAEIERLRAEPGTCLRSGLTMSSSPIQYAYPANDVDPLVASILADHRGQKVLLVGHSNTVPDIIEAAGGPSIDGREFDNLFVFTVCRCGRKRVTLLRLQYGAASP